MFNKDDSNPDLLRPFQNAWSGSGIAKREISVGKRPFPAGYSGAFANTRLADQYHSAVHGCDTDLAYGDDAKDGRPNAAAHRHVHAADLSIYLLQFCRSFGIVLHCTKPVQYFAILSEQATTHADA